MDINNPHDKFFKDIFSDKKKAKELIELALPRVITSMFKWSTLIKEKDSFIDDTMNEIHSDMLYSVEIPDKTIIKIYLLFEHKSYGDKKTQVQLLSYLSRIYSNMEKPEPVIPIVFYHGERKWRVPKRFGDIFDISQELKELLVRYFPDYMYLLIDLNEMDVITIIKSLTMRVIFYTFKNIWLLDGTYPIRL